MNAEERARYEGLESRLRMLEQRIAQIPSRPVVPPTGELRARFTFTAHGLTVGTWVRPGGDPIQWVPALGVPTDYVGSTSSVLPVISGVVSRVFDANSFELTFIGQVEGINNPEDLVDGEFLIGCVYSLSETTAGQLTAAITTTRIECFQATGPHSGIVLQSTKCEATLAIVAGGKATAKVVTLAGALVDASTNPDSRNLGVVINDYSSGSTSVICTSGICVFPAGTSLPGGTLWLDPTNPGELVSVKPTTPVGQRPVLVMMGLGNNVYWVNPPGNVALGVTDLWDVNPAAPADYQILIWDNTAKRYVPGLITGNSITPGAIASASLADFGAYSILANPTTPAAPCSQIAAGINTVLGRGPSGNLAFAKIVTTQITAKAVTAAELADSLAYTVVGNGTNATGSPAGITASTDGTVLNRKGTTLAFTDDLQLGDASTGGATVDIWVSSSISVRVNSSGVITITHGASKTVTIDPAHLTGNYDIRFRELDYCNGATAEKRWVLCDAGH